MRSRFESGSEMYEIVPVTEDYHKIFKEGGAEYKVDTALKTCTCPAFKYSKRPKGCKHLKMAQIKTIKG